MDDLYNYAAIKGGDMDDLYNNAAIKGGIDLTKPVKKGSAAAKARMAYLRSLRGKKKRGGAFSGAGKKSCKGGFFPLSLLKGLWTGSKIIYKIVKHFKKKKEDQAGNKEGGAYGFIPLPYGGQRVISDEDLFQQWMQHSLDLGEPMTRAEYFNKFRDAINEMRKSKGYKPLGYYRRKKKRVMKLRNRDVTIG